jgi:DNA-binding transcriptional LysR family regulator
MLKDDALMRAGLADFHRHYPNEHVELTTGTNDELYTKVADRRIDAAFKALSLRPGGSKSTRWCRWARRASAASVWTNGSGAHRQQPNPASEIRRKSERVTDNERKR